jgi:signal transduction histidine kinase/ActR/RegA family two-component response regulator
MNALHGRVPRVRPTMNPRLLRPFLLVGVGAAGLWAGIYALVGAWVPAVIALSAAAIILVCVLLRERLSPAAISNITVAVTYVAIGALIVVTGGYRGMVAPWLLVLAIVSAFFLTPRGTAIWTGILVLLTLGLVLAPRAGIVYPNTIPGELADVMFSLSLLTAVASGSVLIYFFARLQYDARASVGEANRNLLGLLDTVPEPLIVFEPSRDGRFRCAYVNDPMKRIIGDDPTGRYLDEVGLPEAGATRAHLREVMQSARRIEGRRRVRHRGEDRLIQVISQPLIEGGEVRQIVTIAQDLTRQADDQKRLLHSARLAAIGELVAGVAHEIRNPLMVIGGTADLMDEHDAETLKEDIHAIRSSTRRAARIVDSLLQFSRQSEPRREVVDLNDVVRSVLELRRQLLRHHGISVRLPLAPQPVSVMGDPAQLEQVVLNLVNNAERSLIDNHTKDRWIEIRTARNGEQAHLAIEDSGPGIAPDALTRIFDPFYTTRPVGQGTGLGLSVSYGIVEEHGGTIVATSPEGHGATFSITLPATEASAEAAEEKAKPSAGARTGGGRVLIVDDEPHIRHVVSRYLEKRGYEVREAGDGEAAGRLAEAEPFDVVILDWRMPRLGGAEVLARWRDEDPELAQRVIIATGDVTAEDADASTETTGRPVLAKPFELEDLERLVAAVIAESQPAER